MPITWAFSYLYLYLLYTDVRSFSLPSSQRYQNKKFGAQFSKRGVSFKSWERSRYKFFKSNPILLPFVRSGIIKYTKTTTVATLHVPHRTRPKIASPMLILLFRSMEQWNGLLQYSFLLLFHTPSITDFRHTNRLLRFEVLRRKRRQNNLSTTAKRLLMIGF